MGDENVYGKPKSSQPIGNPQAVGPSSFDQAAMTNWERSFREKPINRLRYLDALLARTTDPDSIARIKDRAAELVRELGAEAVMSDPHSAGIVLQLWGARGYERLAARAKIAGTQRAEVEPGTVANLVEPSNQ